jgi:hypothetical protein
LLYYADKQREIDRDATLQTIERTLALAAEVWPAEGADGYEWALRHHAEMVGAAIAVGEIHQNVADRLCPESDGAFPETDLLANAGLFIGRCVYRSWQILQPGHRAKRANGSAGTSSSMGLTVPDLLEAARSAVDRVAAMDLPPRLEVKVPEGYAFYSLFPEMYFHSLHKLLHANPETSHYTIVGIRSIGTSLATLVAAALQEIGLAVRVETVRPRGHPFDRFISLAPSLQRRLEEACSTSSFLVVDEGPGLTCSSFLSVCSTIEALGSPEGRVTVLAAWRGAPSIYASGELRDRWARQRVIHTDAEDAFDGWKALLPFVERSLGRDGMATEAPTVQDVSYGRWREHAYPSPDRWPVVHRSTERTKLLIRMGDGGQGLGTRGRGMELSPQNSVLAKFAGLGDYGKEKLVRAQGLADAGFAPPVMGLAYGFLLHPYLEGRPLRQEDLCEPLIARMVEYYSFVAQRFVLPPAPRFDALAQMVLLNAREAADLEASAFIARWRHRMAEIDRLPQVRLDGRPFPHEWLEVTGDGRPVCLKMDGADHFRDHTLVGEQSVLWDLAGACEEWEMNSFQVTRLLELWKAETRDGSARNLLGFFRAAYLAFRTAELHYAIHSTNEDDVRRALQHEQWKTNHRLAERLVADTDS